MDGDYERFLKKKLCVMRSDLLAYYALLRRRDVQDTVKREAKRKIAGEIEDMMDLVERGEYMETFEQQLLQELLSANNKSALPKDTDALKALVRNTAAQLIDKSFVIGMKTLGAKNANVGVKCGPWAQLGFNAASGAIACLPGGPLAQKVGVGVAPYLLPYVKAAVEKLRAREHA